MTDLTPHENWIAAGRPITIVTTHGDGAGVLVHAERPHGTGGAVVATSLLHSGPVAFRKLLAFNEARDRWGSPGSVRFTTVVRGRGPLRR